VLTKIFNLSNIRPVPGGSSGMFGSSRCIIVKLLQFGGPKTLPQAAPSLCVQAVGAGEFTREVLRAGYFNLLFRTKLRSRKKIILAKSEMRILRLREVAEARWAHVQGREATA
jgi:hypothetical protein